MPASNLLDFGIELVLGAKRRIENASAWNLDERKANERTKCGDVFWRTLRFERLNE
jgi:hypothetical protein